MTAPNGFYVGIEKCGCVRAALIDDEDTTPKEVAQFAQRQQKAKRSMKHVPAVNWEPHPACSEHAGLLKDLSKGATACVG